MKQVGILVVTYNRLKLLQEEIKSLRKQSFTDYEIIVVNNCSSDGTKSWLSAQNDITAINIEPKNIGPAAAFHTGIKYIAEAGYRYCWLMDDDVECYPDALEELFKAYHLKDNIGFVCSSVIGTDGSAMNVPPVYTKPGENGYATYADMIEHQMIKVRDCTFVSMFFSCDKVYEVGLPYIEFYYWTVDSEYSRRFVELYPCYSVYKSVVIHKRIIQKALSFSTETDPVRLTYWRSNYRNQDYYYYKFDHKFTIKRRFMQRLKEAARYAVYGKWYQAKVILGAAFDLLHFKPKVQFPQKTTK